MYKCIGKDEFKDRDGYAIVALRQEDMENIRRWRNEQMIVLRQQTPLQPEQQQAYYRDVVVPLFHMDKPGQILFSVLKDGTCIGYGGLTYLDWTSKRGEVSFLVDTKRSNDHKTYRQDYLHFLALLKKVAFEELHLHRMFGETYAMRDYHITILEEAGFKYEGRQKDHILKEGKWYDSVMHGFLDSDYALEKKKERVKQGVLITSISKKVPLIEAVKFAAQKLGCMELIHGTDLDPNCIARMVVDYFIEMPPVEKLSREMVRDYCRHHSIGAIIPTRDGDLEFYAQNKSWFEQNGICVMVSSLETVRLCNDKLQFANWLQKNGFPYIPTNNSINSIHADAYVVKECYGAGAVAAGVNLSRHAAEEHAKRLSHPIFQPFISGIEYSVDLFCDKSGKVKGCIARTRDRVVHGESQITTTQHYPAVEILCSQMAQALGIDGHAVFQVIVSSDGSLHVVECNPRFGGASTASIAAGLDTFYWFLLECSGKSLDEYPFVRCKDEVRQIRYAADKIIHVR